VLHEKLAVTQQPTAFHAFYITRRSITCS